MNYTIDDFQVGDILFGKNWACEYEVMSISELILTIRPIVGFGKPVEWIGYMHLSKTREEIQIKRKLNKEEKILAKIALIEKRWKER